MKLLRNVMITIFATGVGLTVWVLLWFVLLPVVDRFLRLIHIELPYLWGVEIIDPMVSVFLAGMIASLVAKTRFAGLCVGISCSLLYGLQFYRSSPCFGVPTSLPITGSISILIITAHLANSAGCLLGHKDLKLCLCCLPFSYMEPQKSRQYLPG
jgi:hypothetical protein